MRHDCDYEPGLEVNEGRVAIPAGSGWGVAFRKAWMEEAARPVDES